MKKFYAIACSAVMAALVAACGGKDAFSVNGTVADDQFEAGKVYLLNGDKVVDSATVTQQSFSLGGKVAEPWIGTLVAVGEAGQATLDFVVEPGSITVDLLDDLLGGTPLNDSLCAFMHRIDNSDLRSELSSYLQLYYSAATPADRDRAEHLYDSVEAVGIDRVFGQSKAFFEGNKDNILGAFALGTMASLDKLTYSELQALVEQASPKVLDYAPLVDKMTQLLAVEQTSPGRHYIDIEGVDGRLSDLVDGHLALVDFYASWCGPCRNEIRDNLVPLWAKYKDKGLVIVGLNVWERGSREAREAAHAKVMAELGITYPQLVDSTRNATNTYGVQGIPQIILIGPDGTILARDLRGSAIEEAIVKAL